MNARRKAARRNAGAPELATPAEAGPGGRQYSSPPRPSGRRAILEEELRLHLEARDATSSGQAFAALSRQIRQLREDLDELDAEDNPTANMSATDILDRTRHIASALPEPVLAIYAEEWARRHRVHWTPDDVETE